MISDGTNPASGHRGVIQLSTATWSGKQERLAVLLAGGRSIKAAAAASDIGERTAHRWLEDPAFRAHVAELRGRVLDEALGRLTDAAVAAADELRALLSDSNSSVRLRAALGIL